MTWCNDAIRLETIKESIVHKLSSSGLHLFEDSDVKQQESDAEWWWSGWPSRVEFANLPHDGPQTQNGRQDRPQTARRFRLDSNGLFPQTLLAISNDEQLRGLALYDFKRYIANLPTDFCTPNNCQHFFEHLGAYIRITKEYYRNDPVGGSRMLLTCLKMVQLLDVLAVSRHQLLREHGSGIPDSKLNDLLRVNLKVRN